VIKIGALTIAITFSASFYMSVKNNTINLSNSNIAQLVILLLILTVIVWLGVQKILEQPAVTVAVGTILGAVIGLRMCGVGTQAAPVPRSSPSAESRGPKCPPPPEDLRISTLALMLLVVSILLGWLQYRGQIGGHEYTFAIATLFGYALVLNACLPFAGRR
jgi:hypothetical protein